MIIDNRAANAPPPQPQPRPRPKNSATKHLCAAAYLDRRFRDTVLDDIYARTDRGVAPSPGTDTAAVIRHARMARGLDIAQYATVSTFLLIVFVSGPISIIEVLGTLFLWQFLLMTVKVTADLGALASGAGLEDRPRFRFRALALITIIVVFLMLSVVLPFIGFAMLLGSSFGGGLM